MARVVIIGNQGFSMLNFRGALIEDLVLRGHEVIALAPDMPQDIQDRLRALGARPIEVDLARTGTNALADLRSMLGMLRLLRAEKPDVVLSYMAKPVIYGTIAAWLAGIPRRFAMIEGLGYVFIPGAKDGWTKKALRQLVKALYRVALSRATRVILLNSDDVSDFVGMKLVAQEKTFLLGGIGVDLERWLPAPIHRDPVTFTLVARLLKDKGVLEFVDAAREVRLTHSEARFILVGGVDDNPKSVSVAELKEWQRQGVVEWTGHAPVGPYLRQTSVFVLPSYREGVPMSTQEAMAMGRAVITTDVPGCRETVDQGINGFLVPARDSKSLAQAMLRFISDPNLIADMGRESRRLAEEKFDVRKVNARIIHLMEL